MEKHSPASVAVALLSETLPGAIVVPQLVPALHGRPPGISAGHRVVVASLGR